MVGAAETSFIMGLPLTWDWQPRCVEYPVYSDSNGSKNGKGSYRSLLFISEGSRKSFTAHLRAFYGVF
jgi:hypothetical protein